MTSFSELLAQAAGSFASWKTSSRHARRSLLQAWIRHYQGGAEPLARLITEETGKPITLARGEVGRGIATLEATVEALGTFGEEALAYDLMAGADGCRARIRQFPRGPVLAITPFNFPVNLALHKLAPALGAGCSVIWKPCPQAPRTSRRLWESFEAARRELGAPEHLVQLADVSPEQAEALALDPGVAVVSFTGSERVGHHLRALLPQKPVLLELGGNAAVVLDAGIDAEAVARQLAPAAVAGAGQSCSKAQRIYVHEALWEAFAPAFVAAVESLPVGDPMDPATMVGPMIDVRSAERVEGWVQSARQRGAVSLLEGKREGALLPPAILTGVPEEEFLACEEAFGPVTVLERVADFDTGLRRAAATRFGLRASAYSRDQRHLRRAEEILRAGGVLLNLPPTFRLDAAPFGGVAASGQGFEGPRYALEAFSEARLIVEGPAL
ncbi:MAG: aldehyde dehydrogenase family protein [Acidobacteria bacterium]|nr:aldehyde dehydrogenase family protein [Acidobacteriota bacterium]